MDAERRRGNVLLLAGDGRQAERIARWIAEAGEIPVVVAGREASLVGRGDDERIDLLVTRADIADVAWASIIRRIAVGELFPDVPQVHLLQDEALRPRLAEWSAEIAALALAPPFARREFAARVRLGAEIGRLRRRLERSSILDSMTALYNRRHMMARLDQEVSRARRHHSPLSLVLLDIDGLRTINEQHGNDVGDQTILNVARVLREHVRREDVLGRCGEECFGVILPDTGYRGAAVLANKVRTELTEPARTVGGEPVRLRLSAGISTFAENPAVAGAADLVSASEAALAEAKRRGGNRTHIDERVIAAERRRIVVADTDAALLALAEDLLELDNYQVDSAESAEAVVSALNSRLPDLLIIDLDLADSAGGRRLFDSLRERFPEARLPIIAMQPESGGDPERAARLGADRFITKPFSVSVLRSLARELLEAPHVRGRV